MIQFPYNEVEGYLSESDRVYLGDLAFACSDLQGPMVEIGSYKGLSALCLKHGAPSKKLFCFDFFEDDKVGAFQANMERAGVSVLGVIGSKGDFRSTIPAVLGNDSIALAFVDHDHQFVTTKAAYELIWPRLSSGGILAFHDYGHPDYPAGTKFIDTLTHKRLDFVPGSSVLAFKKL